MARTENRNWRDWTMQHPWLEAIATIALSLVLAACSGGAPRATPTQAGVTPTPGATAASECAAAFAEAASVDPLHDSVEDLFPAVRVCTLEEWRAEFERHDGLEFIGTADSVLSNMCLSGEIAAEPLCFALDAPSDVEFAKNACQDSVDPSCAQLVLDAIELFPAGSLVAICDYPPDSGNVMLIDTEAEADDACSGGGLISPSRVLRVLALPE